MTNDMTAAIATAAEVPQARKNHFFSFASFGALVLLGGIIGIWSGGVIADRVGEKHKSAYALIPAIAFVATLPFYVVGVLSTSLSMSIVVMIVPIALGLAWLGPILAAVQHLVPANMRSTASAIFLFVNNLIGIGLGTTLIGALSDAMHARFGADSLRYAILAGTGFYLVAALFFILASRRLEKDWNRRCASASLYETGAAPLQPESRS